MGRHRKPAARRTSDTTPPAAENEFDRSIRLGIQDAQRFDRQRRIWTAGIAITVILTIAVCAGGILAIDALYGKPAHERAAKTMECREQYTLMSDEWTTANNLHQQAVDAANNLDETHNLDRLFEVYDQQPPEPPTVQCTTNPEQDMQTIGQTRQTIADYTTTINDALNTPPETD